MELKMYLIPNIEKLVNLVRESRGTILMNTDKNTFIDVKNYKGMKLLKQEAGRRDGVRIRVYDPKDYLNLVNYMIGETGE